MRINVDRLRLEARRARTPIALYAAFSLLGAFSVWMLFHNLTGELPWKDYRQVRVAVSDAKGVVAGQQEVRAAGVRVGVVRSVDLHGARPVLTLSLDRGYPPIYRDAKLRLRPVTPLQDLYVSIEDPGRPASGELSADAVLPAARTEVPVDVSRVLDIFDRSTRTRLHRLLDQLGRGLPDRGERVRAAFTQLAPFLQVADKVGDAMASRRESLTRVVHNSSRLAEALSVRDRQLAGLVRNGNRTLATFADNRGALGATLDELAPTLETLRPAFLRVQALEDQLDPALRALVPVTASLENGLTTLRQFAQDATPALAALRPAVRELKPLASGLSPTAQVAGQVISALNPQATDLDAITKLTEPCLPHIGKFFWRTLSMTKTGDAYGMTPRADVALSVQSVGVARPKDTLTLTKLLPCFDGKVAP